MSTSVDLFFRISRRYAGSAPLAADVTDKGKFFDSAMNARLLEGFERRRLRMRESGLDATLGKRPVPAARAHQEKPDLCAANPVAYRSHLFALAQLADMREPEQLCRRRICPGLPMAHAL